MYLLNQSSTFVLVVDKKSIMSRSAVDEEGTFTVSAQQPGCESSEASGLVDPRFHLFGCGMLLLLICSIFQCSSASSDAYIATFCLICNLICFSLSAFSHWVFNSMEGDPSFDFRLDYMGIILHIWATSISVLLLEIDNDKIHKYGLSGLTLASLAAAFCLFFLPLGKRIRIAAICGLGSFAFLGVLILVAVSSCPSGLSTSYSALEDGITFDKVMKIYGMDLTSLLQPKVTR